MHRRAFEHAFRMVYGVPLSLEGITSAGRTDSWLIAEPLRRAGWSNLDIEARLAEAFEAMQTYVIAHPVDLRHTVLPGVPELLTRLQRRGISLGLVTGNLSGVARVKLAQAGIGHFFQCGGYGEESQSRADLVRAALRHAPHGPQGPRRPDEAVVIGDTPLDLEAARLAGAHAVAVATGPCTLDELLAHAPDAALVSFADVVASEAAILDTLN